MMERLKVHKAAGPNDIGPRIHPALHPSSLLSTRDPTAQASFWTTGGTQGWDQYTRKREVICLQLLQAHIGYMHNM